MRPANQPKQRLFRPFAYALGTFVLLEVVLLDGVCGTFTSALWSDASTYAEGYRYHRFMAVLPGMRRETVLQLLGPPLTADAYPDGVEWLHYSDRHESTGGVRVVRLQDGRVLWRASGFYVD